MTFTKLFSSITESTIWTLQPNHIRIAWITLLAMSDRFGRVWSTIPGLAARARITIEEAEEALACFKQPDKYSRTPDNEGRRIEDIDGGWRLLNHGKYRAIRDEEAIKESKRKYINTRRAKDRDKSLHDSTVERSRAIAEAEPLQGQRGALKSPKMKIPPEESDWKWYAIEIGLSDEDQADCWDFYSSNGWKVSRNPMKDWKAVMRRWKKNAAGLQQRPHHASNGNGKAKSSIWETKQRLEAKEEQMKAIRNEGGFEAAMGFEWQDKDKKAEWLRLRSDVKALKAEIAG